MITISISRDSFRGMVERLRAFLEEKGHSVQHTHGREALARALGYANCHYMEKGLGPNVRPQPGSDRREPSPSVTASTKRVWPEPVSPRELTASRHQSYVVVLADPRQHAAAVADLHALLKEKTPDVFGLALVHEAGDWPQDPDEFDVMVLSSIPPWRGLSQDFKSRVTNFCLDWGHDKRVLVPLLDAELMELLQFATTASATMITFMVAPSLEAARKTLAQHGCNVFDGSSSIGLLWWPFDSSPPDGSADYLDPDQLMREQRAHDAQRVFATWPLWYVSEKTFQHVVALSAAANEKREQLKRSNVRDLHEITHNPETNAYFDFLASMNPLSLLELKALCSLARDGEVEWTELLGSSARWLGADDGSVRSENVAGMDLSTLLPAGLAVRRQMLAKGEY